MKEFTVCYTLENEIKRERLLRDSTSNKEEVVQEILEKVSKSKYLLAKGTRGDDWINTTLIRYIRVKENTTTSLYHPINNHISITNN